MKNLLGFLFGLLAREAVIRGIAQEKTLFPEHFDGYTRKYTLWDDPIDADGHIRDKNTNIIVGHKSKGYFKVDRIEENKILAKKVISMKNLLGFLFGLFLCGSALAQPSTVYYMKVGGPTGTLTSQPPSGTGCLGSGGVTQYGFKYLTTTYYSSANATSCGGTSCVFASGSSMYTVSPSGNTVVQTIEYVSRPVTYMYSSGCTINTIGANSLVYNVNVTSYNDLTPSGLIFPSSICSSAATIDLSNYVTLHSAIKSSIIYKLDGNIISSNLNPASVTPGPHSLTATFNWLNGATTVSIGSFTHYQSLSGVTNPTDQTICSIGNAIFTTTGTGTGITYQWQESINGGATWSNLNNASVYSGTNTASLTISNPGLGYSNYKYRCLLNDQGNCNPVTTTAANLSMYSQVGILTSPTNTATCIAGGATFTATGTPRSGALQFQWQDSPDGSTGWADLINQTYTQYTVTGATASTLTLSNASFSANNRWFRCVLKDDCGAINSITTAAGKLTVYPVVSITSQPSDKIVCQPGNTTFSVTATAGSGVLTYRWQVSTNNGTSYTDLSDGGFYTNTDKATLTLTAATSVLHNNWYRCKVMDVCGLPSQTISNKGILTIKDFVSVTTQPANTSILCPAASASFTTAGTGTGLNYQWQENQGSGWVDLTSTGLFTGATSATLGISPLSTAMNGYQYRCVLKGDCGNVNSNAATLSVGTNGGIGTQPAASTTLCPSSGYNLSVVASGTGPFSYQWKKGAVNVGTNAPNFSIGSVTAGDAGTYTVTVTGACGASVTSANAVLTVNTNVGISTQPVASTTLCPASTYNLTVVASGTGPYTYQWKKGATNVGTNSANFSIASVAAGDAATYTVVVTGACGNITSSSASLTVNTITGITTQPVASTTLCPSGTFNLGVVASGTGPFTYQWKKGATNVGTNSANFSIASVAAGDAGTYTVTVTGACGTVTSASAALGLYSAPTIGTNLPSTYSYCSGSSGAFTVAGSSTPGPVTYSWELSTDGGGSWNPITNIAPYSGATTGTLSVSALTGAFANYKYRATITDATCTLNKVVSNVLTVNPYANVTTTNPVSVGTCNLANASFTSTGSPKNGGATYQWQLSTNSGGSWANVTNGGVYSGATTTTLNITAATNAMNSYLYRAIVQDGCGTVTQVISNPATLSVYGGATITTQPTNLNLCSSTSGSFSVVGAASNGSLTYQWFVNPNTGTFVPLGNTTVYSGVTSATLSLTNPPNTFDNYQYYVVVKDACTSFSTQSSTVNLKYYISIPVTTAPINQVVCPNAPAGFTVAATANTGTLTYQWQVSTNAGVSYTNVPAVAPYGTSGTTSALSITSAPVAMNGYLYKVIVTDGCGATTQYTSPAVNLTVNNSVNITQDLATTTSPCLNGAMVLKVTASGTGITYQWQENTGSGWNNIPNIGIYSGALTNQLTVSSVPSIYTGYQYRALINGTCSSTTSNVTTVSVITAPTVTNDPSPITTCSGNNAFMTVVASGTNPTYSWQYSATGSIGSYNTISGTAATLTLSNVTVANNGFYRSIVTNSCGSNTSNGAKLTVNPLAAITTQPASTSVCPAGSVSISVTGTGTAPLSYLWEKDPGTGVFAAFGTNTPTISITNATNSDGGKYRVTVTGACGSGVLSSAATLTVNPTPAIPTVLDVARCGDGAISTTASSTSPTPTFNWYANSSDVVPVFTGATRNISNLTITQSQFVTVTSLTCESSKKEVVFTRNAPQSVDLGNALTLCAGQAAYNLENDISDPIAKGSNFTWTAGSTNYSSKVFDPVVVGLGTYTLTYIPPSAAQLTPNCYLTTTRTVTVTTGAVAINFNDPLISGGNTVNTCVGNTPIAISDFPSVAGGTWSVVSGSGISSSGASTIFTPSSSTYTSTTPNVFRYTVTSGGCSGTKDLSIYVKDNQSIPVVSGLSPLVCPGAELSLSVSVATVGSYTFQWFKAGSTTAFALGTTLNYTANGNEDILVRSVDNNFGCLSVATVASIKTPFAAGVITVNKSVVDLGDFVKYNYSVNTAGNTYLWEFGDGGISKELSPAYYYFKPGQYTTKLKVTSTLGCSQDTKYEFITVNGTQYQVITGSEPSTDGTKYDVYPIPTKDELVIDGEAGATYTVYSLNGNVILELKASSTNTRIDLRDVASGVYRLVIQNGKLFKSVPIIKN